jgi:hypothetical protein
MALQDRFVGKNLGVKFEYGGTVISLDGDQTSFDVTHGVQSAEITAGTDGGVWEIKTLEEITYSLSSFYLDDLSSNDWGALDMGLQGTLTYAPDGFSQGTVFSSRVFVNAKPESISFNDGVVRNVEFGGQGQLAGPFLFLDNFTVADAAPLANPKLADVLGGWDVSDSGNDLNIIDEYLEIGNRVDNSNPRVNARDASGSVEWDRKAGVALFFRGHTPTAADGHTRFGWHNLSTGAVTHQAYRVQHIGLLQPTIVNVSYRIEPDSNRLDDEIDYDYAIILRDTGCLFFVKGGTQFPVWTLGYIDDTLTSTPLYAAIAPATTVQTRGMDFSTARIAQLAEGFDSDFGIATERLAGARTAGDTFTHTANCLIEFVVTTVPTSGRIRLSFRSEDVINTWRVTIDALGNIDLDEMIAGVPTERGTSAAAITDGDRILISAIGSIISVFDPSGRLIHYESASIYINETAGELTDEGTGGAVDDIVVWPATSHDFDKYFTEAQ